MIKQQTLAVFSGEELFEKSGVRHVAIKELRKVNADNLRHLPVPWVLHADKMPLAVLLRYEHFLGLQTQLQALLNTMETIVSKKEFAALAGQLDEIQQVARTNALKKINAFYRKD